MISWNHRVVREEDGLLRFSEVHYDERDKTVGYSEPFMCGETPEILQELLERLQFALTQPILDASEIGGENKLDNVEPAPKAWDYSVDMVIEEMLKLSKLS